MTDSPRIRVSASEALRAALAGHPAPIVQTAIPGPRLTLAEVDRLIERLEKLHTAATLGEPIRWLSGDLHALVDTTAILRDYRDLIRGGLAALPEPRATIDVLAERARASSPARASDPSTSKDAGQAKHREPSHRNQLGRLLLAFRLWEQRSGLDDDDQGLTSEEVAAAAGVSLRSEYAKRCSELKDGGYIVAARDENGAEVTREGATGRPRVVWTLTDKGRRAAAELVDVE